MSNHDRDLRQAPPLEDPQHRGGPPINRERPEDEWGTAEWQLEVTECERELRRLEAERVEVQGWLDRAKAKLAELGRAKP